MTERTRLISQLKRHDIHLKRGLGQHFLTDDDLLDRIAEATGAGRDANLVEVGAGAANLTRRLAKTGAHITAIELDRRFERMHTEVSADVRDMNPNVQFVYCDALEFDYAAAAREAHEAGRRFLVAGNIPYQITSPLTMRVLETNTRFDQMTLLMQREVAQRLAAAPGSKRNGAITIKVQFYCKVQTLLSVPRTAFIPPPEVESELVSFTPVEPALEESQREEFFRLVEASFAQRRKMLPNAAAAAGSGYTREELERALEKIGLPITVRAEQLGLPEFLKFYAAVSEG